MTDFSFVLFYVNDPRASAAFYTDLLGRPPVEMSPTFAMLPLREGCMLGLWSRHTVTPAPSGAAGAGEIAFTVADADAVQATHSKWTKLGLKIVQEPVRLDMGLTFVAVDPDGHRLRVFAPEAE